MTKRPADRRFLSRQVAVAAVVTAMTLLLALGSVAGAASLSPRELVPLLTRSGVGPDWTIIDVIYAPQLFFDATGIPVPEDMDPDRSLAFILNESVHEGELPLEPPQAFLLLPDDQRLAPYDARITADDVHHRTSRLLFERPEGWPDALANPDEGPVLRLIVPNRDGSYSIGNTFEWSVPIVVDD